MTVTIDDLRTEVGAGANSHTSTLQRSLALAAELVDKYLLDNEAADDVPETVRDQAVLATAVDAFNQSQAPNGVLNQTFETADGGTAAVPVRISADPLRPAYPLLAMWITPVVG